METKSAILQRFRFHIIARTEVIDNYMVKIISSYSMYKLSSNNYTCDEVMRWLGTEKHYSNDKKEMLFAIYSKKCDVSNTLYIPYNFTNIQAPVQHVKRA